MKFEKWQGLGNDFILVEGEMSPAQAAALCDRRRGIGGDGVLSIETSPPRMVVLNADGSRPEMCGNGLRCVAGWLAERGLAKRKGFPESYDTKALLGFLAAVKSGQRHVAAPLYSHVEYDVLADKTLDVDQPDVLIVEGLNVLQPNPSSGSPDARRVVSDYFDFSIYVHAEESLVKQWFLDRFAVLRQTAFTDEQSYFRRYATMDEADAMAFADSVWDEINAVNLVENILPTRERANLILCKHNDHSVEWVDLRKR